MQAARNWGDGATTRSRHIAADVRFYGDMGSTLVCSDGVILSASTPEELERLWQEHGGKAMYIEADDRVAPEPLFDVDRSSAAMGLIAAIGRRCICVPGSDVSVCPNYTPLDDEGDDS